MSELFRDPPAPPPVVETIGVGRLLDDGTIELQLRAQGTGGIVGDALLRYPTTHKDYAVVRAHLGEIAIGAWVPVRPFPNA